MSHKKRQSSASRASKKAGTFGRVAPVPKATPSGKVVAPVDRLNLYAEHRNEYLASAMASFVRVGPATYLAFDGHGKPGAPDFATGIGAMTDVALTVKAHYKSAGRNYAIMKVEALWWRGDDTSAPTKDTVWNWQLLMRVPPFVTANDLQKAVAVLIARGKSEDVRRVQLIELREETCVQILHVGSYQEEGPSIAKMRAFVEMSGRSFTGKHHEIYLSDPNKTAGDKLRTILRQPVS
jgi:hypothetical protein